MNDVPHDSAPRLPSTTKSRRRLASRLALWTLAAAATLIVLGAVSIALLLHNERFHNYLLTIAQQKASDSLGVRVHLQNFAVNLSHLDLDLYGISVEGAAPYANPPLLQVDHAEVSVRIVSILHGKWYLESLRVDRPIVRIFVDAKGVSNIPTIKSSTNTDSGSKSIFDLAVRRAILKNGEIYYNDRRSLLAADLHDVEFQASFNSLLQSYSGKVSYTDGHLTAGTLETIPHSLEAEFDATSTTFHLTQAKLSTGPSRVLLTATVRNYSDPDADVVYDATIDGVQVARILNNSSVPAGQVHATGSLHYKQSAGRSLLDSLVLRGDASSRELNVKTTSMHARITSLSAHYSLENGDINLHDITLHLLGGAITGSGVMTHIAGDPQSKVEASLRGVSLEDLMGLAPASTRSVGIAGSLNGELAASWGKNFDDVVAHADAKIDGRVQAASQGTNGTAWAKVKSSSAESTGIPLESAIHAVYQGKNKQLTLNDSYLRTPGISLSMSGTVSDHSSLGLRLQADDLRDVESITDLFRKAPPGQPLQPLGLSGTASFQGAVRGSVTAPHLTGEVLALNLHINGSEWKQLRTNVDVSPSLVSLQHGDLEPASRGHIAFNAAATLTKWSFTNSSPVQLDVDASHLSIAALTALAGQSVPVSGTLAASIKLHGTVLNPVGSGSVSAAGLVAYDQPITSAKITFSGTGDEAHADLAVQLPTGSIESNVMVRPKQKTYVAKLTAAGIRLDKLQALKALNLDASGEVSLNASGQGSLDDPQLDATLQTSKLVIQKQTITGLNLRVSVANHVANATLLSTAVNTSIQAKARINLTGDYLADASLDTQAIPLQPLFAIYAPSQSSDLSGETEIHATLHGPLKDKNQLEAHLTIPTLKLAYGSKVQLAASTPIRVDFENRIINVQRSTVHGTDTDLQFQATIPTSGNAPMSVMLLGTINLQLAQLFDPEVRAAGELKLAINSNGSSELGGKIDIVNASYSSDEMPVGLQNGNGTLTITRDRINIARFQGTVGGGTMTAQGGVALRPAVQFDLGLAMQGVRMLYPQGLREGIDASLRLAGTTDSAVLGGSINVTDLSFTSAFDLSHFIGQFASGVTSPPTPGFSQNLQLNLAVRSSSDINLVSRTLSVDGSANLMVRGTAANPVILGRVNLNNGDIILNGDRFVLNGGTVEFVNPSETQPILNVSLKTTIQQYDVYLRFNGPVDQLRTNYSSDPALPSADIINLLAFGKTTEADAANPSTPANQAAAGLIASQVSSQVTSRFSKIAGISQLSINPVLAGGTTQGNPGANITIQQRVTGNLFVTFSSNVASTQTQTIQGQYQLSPRVALSATRDQNGGFAFDALIKKAW